MCIFPLAFTFVVSQRPTDRMEKDRWAPNALFWWVPGTEGTKTRFRDIWRSFYFLPGWVSEPGTLDIFIIIFKRNESSMYSSSL